MRTNLLLSIALAFLVGVLCALILVQTGAYPLRDSNLAWAQDSAATSYMLGLVGATVDKDLPIVLVDARQQTIMLYQFNTTTERLKLSQVRSYKYDRLLEDFNGGRAGNGPSVEDVKKVLQH